jgi:hypothetical protein
MALDPRDFFTFDPEYPMNYSLHEAERTNARRAAEIKLMQATLEGSMFHNAPTDIPRKERRNVNKVTWSATLNTLCGCVTIEPIEIEGDAHCPPHVWLVPLPDKRTMTVADWYFEDKDGNVPAEYMRPRHIRARRYVLDTFNVDTHTAEYTEDQDVNA